MTGVLVPKGPRVSASQPRDLPDYARDMPAWWEARDSQLDAVEKLVAGYEAGARVMFLDAPTGTGKTAMGDLTRRRLQVSRGLYVCTTKSLQDQIMRDFGYARVLKGRRNYTPLNITSRERDGYRQGDRGASIMGISCADCDASGGEDEEEMTCSYCGSAADCPYRVARRDATVAELGVLNTSYLLAACNMTRNSPFAGRELVIADECALLEDELLGFVEVKVGKRWVDKLGLTVPKKGSHMTTIRAWLREEVEPGLKALQVPRRTLDERREYKRWQQLYTDVNRVLDREDGWVRDGDDEERDGGGLVLKPISIEDVGARYLWQHAKRWLCMDGAPGSVETMAESLGLEEAGIEWGVVRLDMPFDKSKRPIVFVPSGLMTRAGQQAGGLDATLAALDKVVAKHPGDNILVHTFSYHLAKQAASHLRAGDDTRPVLTYNNARDRDGALAAFRRAAGEGGAVLVAASMDRGIDLPGDDCRVQVVLKMPYASLGSRQVAERLRTPGGQAWYLSNAIRTLMQQGGRAVRGMDDSATTYILDAAFSKTLKEGKRAGMFPTWWLEALSLGRL